MNRPRVRDLGITIGALPPGLHNAITDVDGVLVGHTTLVYDSPRVARTGVTVVLPRPDTYASQVFGAFHSFNGNGEMTGMHWLEESGLINAPIGITNTHAVGVVRDALVAHTIEQHSATGWLLPIAAETYDGMLNDINAFHVTREHVFAALAAARGGPVAEGNVGGGTGMICHGFKGGIGTASRIATTPNGAFTVGALVQANYGMRGDLRVDGVPVGQAIGADVLPLPAQHRGDAGSIIVILATDAPLLPIQCKRLARRATVGLARVGGNGFTGSGDIFLAFATGNTLPRSAEPLALAMLPHDSMNELFRAAAESTEEAILNALCAAETMHGFNGSLVHALPHDELLRAMGR